MTTIFNAYLCRYYKFIGTVECQNILLIKVMNKLLIVGCRMSDGGWWMEDVGWWMLNAGCRKTRVRSSERENGNRIF